MGRKILAGVAMLLVLGLNSLHAQTDFSLELAGSAALPLGKDSAVFGTGLEARGGMMFPFPPVRVFSAGIGFSYLGAAVQDAPGVSLGVLDLEACLAFRLLSIGPLSLSVGAGGGGYYASLSDGSGSAFYPSVSGGLRLAARFGMLVPFLGARYTARLGLVSGIELGAGLAVYPSAQADRPLHKASTPKTPDLKIKPLSLKSGPGGLAVLDLSFDPVFPVYYRWYDGNALGTLVVRNDGTSILTGLQATFLVKQFMDNAKECPGPDSLAPGEEARIPIFALFSDSILGVSEGNKVSANLGLNYSSRGKAQRFDLSTSLTLYDRNSLTWQDDRRAAAFVTAKDPLVLRFAKNLAGYLQDAHVYNLPKPLLAALGVFESLRRYGMRYASDPTSSYASMSKDKTAIDFVQFPRQTLDFKAGDCDDLSVLSSALLEALGAKTAFVTVPGHIFVAVDLGLTPVEARKRFVADLLVVQGERVWLPFEVTNLGEDFLKAWDLGAREWREAFAKNEARLYPVEEAWALYPPVGFVSEAAQAQAPDPVALASDCLKLLERYSERQLAPAVAALTAEMRKSGRSPKLINKLGVTYALGGLIAPASDAFKEAIAKEEFIPALVNLGNLAFLTKDFSGALAYYERALKKNSQDPRAMLGSARANSEMENYGQARAMYTRLVKVDPALAAQFSYLDLRGEESSRAAEAAGTKELVLWSE